MRKSLLAVALACAFPAAFAQSAVTLYGIVDVGFERLDAGDVSGTRLQSGISQGSRWGIRGSEDLGGGYRALFTLESRFSIETGSVTNNDSINWCRPVGATTTPVCPGVTNVTPLPPALQPAVVGGMNTIQNELLRAITTVNSAGALFDRQAYLGLVTPVGAVLAGRQYTPGYEIINKFNVIADMTALQFGQGHTTPQIRANNAIQYRAELKGFVLSLMYGFGGNETLRNERATDPTGGDDFMGGNVQYVTSNWGVGAGYNRTNVVPAAITPTGALGPATKETGLETINVGGWVGFGDFRVYAQWMSRQNDHPMLTPLDIQRLAIASATPAGALATLNLLGSLQLHPTDMDLMRGFAGPTDSDAYHLGASWTFGASKLYGVYNWGKDTARSEWATQDAKAAHFGVAYFYNLSIRTALYGVAAFLKNSDQSRMSLSSAGYTTGWTTGFGEDASAFQLGIRHMF
jgi:general bacterial porin, GBP family